MKSNFTDLIWLRNYVVAPISEEFTFRACIIPLLLQCFQPMTAVFICPVFFGAGKSRVLQMHYNHYSLNINCLAHFNQWIERIQAGIPCLDAFLMSGKLFNYQLLIIIFDYLHNVNYYNLNDNLYVFSMCEY